ncbi:MAG: DUF975 family protein [Oscillospiraceae bacterium]|nr:DUF975 family protein [Oscillospiraceae bacterium]
MLRKEVKTESRKILVEKWWSVPLLANLFLLLVSVLFNPKVIFNAKEMFTHVYNDGIVSVTKTTFAGFSILNLGIAIFYYLVICALSLGLTRLVYNYFGDRKQQFSSIFYYFSTPQKFFSAVWLNVNVFLRSILWGLPMLCIFLLYWYTNTTLNSSFKATGSFNLFLVYLGIAYFIFFLVIMNRYSLAEVIFIKNDGELTVNKSINLSVKVTKGHLGELFVLDLSLLPLLLLYSLSVVSIVFIFMAPFIVTYINFVYTLYYKRMLENYEKRAEVVDVPAEAIEDIAKEEK